MCHDSRGDEKTACRGQGSELRSSWMTASSLTQWAVSLVWESLVVQVLIHAVWSTNNTNENWMPQFQECSSMECYFHPTRHMRKLSQQRGWRSCPGHLTRYQRSFQVLGYPAFLVPHWWGGSFELGRLCCAVLGIALGCGQSNSDIWDVQGPGRWLRGKDTRCQAWLPEFDPWDLHGRRKNSFLQVVLWTPHVPHRTNNYYCFGSIKPRDGELFACLVESRSPSSLLVWLCWLWWGYQTCPARFLAVKCRKQSGESLTQEAHD